jgi:hypothetical protein
MIYTIVVGPYATLSGPTLTSEVLAPSRAEPVSRLITAFGYI